MRKYILKLQELGLTVQTVSKKIQKEIKDFTDGEAEFNNLKEQLSSMDENDEDYQAVSKSVEEYETLLEDADNELAERIQVYSDNKEEYDRRMQGMRDANAAKKAAKKDAAASAAANPAPPSPPAPAPNPPVVVIGQNEPPTPPAPPAPKVEKESNFGEWVLWGGLGVLGLVVGINLFKNRN